MKAMSDHYKISIKLKREAKEAATFRGHELGRWKNYGDYYASLRGKIVSLAICKRCGMDVVINTKPQPNDIEISGEAVALNCAGGGIKGAD